MAIDPNQEENLVKRKASILARVRRPLSAILILGMLATGCSNLTGDEPNNDPTNNSQTDQNNHENSENYKDYSKLLQNVISNTDYQNIISNHKNGNLSDAELTRQSHPYAFLETKGHDVSKIKSGELQCYTNAYYFQNSLNDLYMMVAVEDSNCFTNYLLKYTLSDTEMREYIDMYNIATSTGSGHFAYQLFFMNDQISKDKEVSIQSEAKISKKAYNDIHEDTSAVNYFKHNLSNSIFETTPHAVYNAILKDYNVDSDSYRIYVLKRSDLSSNVDISTDPLGLVNLTSDLYGPVIVENNILVNPNNWDGGVSPKSIGKSNVCQFTLSSNYESVCLLDLQTIDRSIISNSTFAK